MNSVMLAGWMISDALSRIGRAIRYRLARRRLTAIADAAWLDEIAAIKADVQLPPA